MGKKSRLKRRKYNLLKNEFVQYICPQCGLCNGKVNPEFCYEAHYVEDPKGFVKNVLKSLQEIKEGALIVNPAGQTIQDDDEFEFTLEEAFCAHNLCNKGVNGGANCPYKIGCLQALRSQIRNENKNLITFRPNRGHKVKKNNRNKRAKKQKKVYVPPTPKFFCNESFWPEVNRIINGTNAEQQDTSEKSTGHSTEHAGGEATYTKS